MPNKLQVKVVALGAALGLPAVLLAQSVVTQMSVSERLSSVTVAAASAEAPILYPNIQ